MKAFDRVALYAALLLVVVAVGGCCTSAASSATCARKVVGGMYAGIGASAVLGLACDATARAQGDAGNLSAANQTYGACETMNASLHVAENATDGASQAVDSLEKLGVKDYSAAIAPALTAGCDLGKAAQGVATAIKKPLPVVIPCGGK